MTVLVTGGSGAIGAACVDAFLRDGDHVVAQDLDASRWEGVEGVTTVSGDLMSESCRQALAQACGEELRAVVAAHGIAGSATLADCTTPFVQKVLAVNATTIPLLYASVAPHLARTGGAFIAVASQASLTGEAGNTAYCAAKFAVLGWVKAMAAAGMDATFHALCPGATDSPLLMDAQKRFAAAENMSAADYYDARARQIAVGRYGAAEEIAAAAAYLSGPGTRPTILAVTGGDVLY